MATPNISLREMFGGWMPAYITGFVELEAAVAATTILRHLSSIGDAAVDPTMPYDGFIVGMTASSEAGSNFTVDCTVNAVPDTATTMTVNSAKEYVNFKPTEFVPFSAGDTVGMECTADTTSKDVKGGLLVVWDVSGD